MTPIAKIWAMQLITPILTAVDYRLGKITLLSPAVIELLLGTVAHESGGFKYPAQVGGPALGYFGMEPATALDTIQRTEEHYPLLYAACLPWVAGDPDDIVKGLIFNIDSQIVLARLKYWLSPGRLPAYGDLTSQATYYKQYWNTVLGKSNPEKYISDWNRYVKGE